LREAIQSIGITACVQRVGSMITVFFHAGPIKSWSDAAACDKDKFAKFHAGLLAEGVYWPPAQFEAAFISGAHSDDDIQKTVQAATKSLKAL